MRTQEQPRRMGKKPTSWTSLLCMRIVTVKLGYSSTAASSAMKIQECIVVRRSNAELKPAAKSPHCFLFTGASSGHFSQMCQDTDLEGTRRSSELAVKRELAGIECTPSFSR
jgi:hypothetical protein